MALRLITAPTALAVSVADAKAHLRVDGTDDDTLISAMITAAAELAEQATGRALMPQTWELTLDAFPAALQLTRLPAASVASITYADSTGTIQTLPSNLYALDNADDFGFASIVPAYASSWPATRDQINAVAVRYVAGYADASHVPESIKSWIKLMVGAMYENRAAEEVGNVSHPLGFADRLLDRYKVWSL
ncbi:MAG: head-tail connector protein [Aquabacterium sp.]|nr:head-tail connector protein [Aquabacterium sp.]